MDYVSLSLKNKFDLRCVKFLPSNVFTSTELSNRTTFINNLYAFFNSLDISDENYGYTLNYLFEKIANYDILLSDLYSYFGTADITKSDMRSFLDSYNSFYNSRSEAIESKIKIEIINSNSQSISDLVNERGYFSKIRSVSPSCLITPKTNPYSYAYSTAEESSSYFENNFSMIFDQQSKFALFINQIGLKTFKSPELNSIYTELLSTDGMILNAAFTQSSALLKEINLLTDLTPISGLSSSATMSIMRKSLKSAAEELLMNSDLDTCYTYLISMLAKAFYSEFESSESVPNVSDLDIDSLLLKLYSNWDMFDDVVSIDKLDLNNYKKYLFLYLILAEKYATDDNLDATSYMNTMASSLYRFIYEASELNIVFNSLKEKYLNTNKYN